MKFRVEGNWCHEGVAQLLLARGWEPTSGTDWNLFWGREFPQPAVTSGSPCYANHFRNSTGFTDKNFLYRRVEAARARHGCVTPGAWDFLPLTFEMPFEREAFRSYATAHPGSIWIAKPSNLGRGEGIFILPSPDHAPREKGWIVQEYLANPHLINGRKYDLRLYVVITSLDPLLVFLYRDALLGQTATAYTTEPGSFSDRVMHLTNRQVQAEQGAMIPRLGLDEFQSLITREGGNFDRIWQRIRLALTLSILSSRDYLMRENPRSSLGEIRPFAILGVDILIDAEFRPWIIEFNRTPALGMGRLQGLPDHEHEERLKSAVLAGALQIAGPLARSVPPTDEEGLAAFVEENRGNFELLFPGPEASIPGNDSAFVRESDRRLFGAFGVSVPSTHALTPMHRPFPGVVSGAGDRRATAFSTRLLGPEDWEEFRAMRLHALEMHPSFMPFIEDHSDRLPLEIERSWNEDVWKSFLTDAVERQFFGLFTGSALIGFGQLKHLGAGVAEMKSAFIMPEYRGLGLWRLLLNARLQHAVQNNCEEIRIGHRIENTLMEQALAGSGFVEICREQMKNKYQDGVYGSRVVMSMRPGHNPGPAARLASIYEIIASRASRSPASAALVAPGGAMLDYRGLHAHLDAVGSVLNDGGVGQGDRVALLIANGPAAASMLLSVGCFATAVPVNPETGVDELGGVLGSMSIRAIVADIPHRDLARVLAAKLRATLFVLAPVTDSIAGCVVPDASLPVRAASRRGPSEAGADAVLFQTSGTTGSSKVVPMTHDNIMAAAAQTVKMMSLTPEDRGLCLAPFFHRYGIVTGLMVPLVSGGSVIYPPAFDPAVFFDSLAGLKPTWYSASPTVHKAILDHAPAYPESVAGHSLRFIRSGAAALPSHLMQEIERVFRVPVIEAYGMTEAGIACNPLPPALRKPGKVGLSTTEVAIMGPGDIALECDEIGEIAVRGACVTRGYEGNPQETADRFRNGWFFTGDLGRLDTDGYLEVTGRLTDIINRGGRKVNPVDVEERLCKHPCVSDAAAFSVPHPSLGEDLVAAVVLKADAPVVPQHLREYLFRRWAGYKVPSRIFVVNEIPRGTTGKLERRHLASRFQACLQTGFVAPESAMEIELTEIFAEVLRVEAGTVGLHDSFFALGGDSLGIVELILALQKRLNLGHLRVSNDIVTAELTPAGVKAFLAVQYPDDAAVGQNDPGVTSSQPSPPVAPHPPVEPADELPQALSTPCVVATSDLARHFASFDIVAGNVNGSRPPIFWCLQEYVEFEALRDAIGSDQPIYVFRSGFPPDRSDRLRRELGERYAKAIAGIEPGAPKVIGGNCSGANVVWEAVEILQAGGVRIDLLFLMEATILRSFPRRVVMLYGEQSHTHSPFLAGRDLHPEWRRLYGSYTVDKLPGDHGFYFAPRNVPVLAGILRRHLDEYIDSSGQYSKKIPE